MNLQEYAAHNGAKVSVVTNESANIDKQFITEDCLIKETQDGFNKSLEFGFPFELKSFEWITPKSGMSIFPCVLDYSIYGNRYNCYMTKSIYPISSRFRAKIPKNADAFHGITLPCIDATVDIKSVTLFLGLLLPVDKNERLGNKEEDSYLWNADKSRNLYIPVKKIINPKTNRITFDDQPIIISNFFSYSIEIEYTNYMKKSFSADDFGVQVEEYFFMNSDQRREVIQSARLFERNMTQPKAVYLIS